MPTLNEVAGVEDEQPKSIDHMMLEDEREEEVQSGMFDLSGLLEFIRKPTGEGSIESYLDHPLNFNNSKGMAQIIRGISGGFGDVFNSWIVDIAFGYMRLKREAVAVD